MSTDSSPLRISIVQGAFLPVPPLLGGAVEKAWYALGQEFARAGHQVTHVSRAHPALPAANVEHGVQHRRIRGYDTPASLWRLKQLDLLYSLRARRVLPPGDVVVTNTFWMPIVERRRSRGVPYVHVARYPKGQMRLYGRRAVLQTVSEPIRAAILREAPRARVQVVPYPVGPAYLSEAAPAATPPVILYTGRLHPEKGVHLLIDAFVRATAGALQNWTLRIVGPWRTEQGGGGSDYRERLRRSAQPAGARIELLEPIFDETELARQYRGAAVFAYPSLAEQGETFGLAVLEAMASGCAPVVSSLGCFQDFVRAGENGFVFDHREADPAASLAEALASATASAAELARRRAAAWTTAHDYTLPEIAGRFIAEFRRLREPHAGTGSYVEACLPDSR